MKREKKSKLNFNSIKKLYKYIYPYKTRFYIGLIFLLLTSLASLYFAELIGELVTKMTVDQWVETYERVLKKN